MHPISLHLHLHRASAVAALIFLAGCARAAPSADAPAAAGTRGSYSVYELGSSWTTQDGVAITLDSLRGRPRVLALVYTHCTAACPLAIAELKRIESQTDARLGFVLVSLDPERDTPAALAGFARATGLSPARWTLLAGSDADVRDLAALLGVRYRRQSSTEIAHSSTLLLLDAEGRVRQRQDGLGDPDGGLVTAAHALLH